MPQFEPGLYTILTKGGENVPGLGIIAVPLSLPPPDLQVLVVDPPFVLNWIIQKVQNNTFTAFAGRGRPDDFKWIVKDDNVLYITSRQHAPDSFRFESAGNGFWKIGIFGKDAVLTYNKGASSKQLTFEPADGSDAQLFQAEPIKVPRD